jgi:F-type H+-transporting ATPase subunit delta
MGISKIYANSLVVDLSVEDMKSIHQNLNDISSAFVIEKFKDIMLSDASPKSKADLLLSFVDSSDSKLVNLINLLSANKRLNFLPEITEEVFMILSNKTKVYNADLYSDVELSSSNLDDIKTKLEKKFDVELNMIQKTTNTEGVQINIDGLGLNIGFSKNNFEDQIQNFILKSI